MPRAACPYPLTVTRVCSEPNRGRYMWPGQGSPTHGSQPLPALSNPARPFPHGCVKTPEATWCSHDIGTFLGISGTSTSDSEAEAPCTLGAGSVFSQTYICEEELPKSAAAIQSVKR